MPENVRRYADGETGFFGVMMKALTDCVTAHPASERRDEEGGLSRIGELGPARFDVDFDGFLGFRSERNEAVFTSFPLPNVDQVFVQAEICDIEIQEFAQAQTGAVEEFHPGSVTEPFGV